MCMVVDTGQNIPVIRAFEHVIMSQDDSNIFFCNPSRDEIVDLGDVIMPDNGRIFFTYDRYFETISIGELRLDTDVITDFITRPETMNALMYDPEMDVIYIAENTLNKLTSVTLNRNIREIVNFDNLASGQQAVPSGVAVDPLTGDLLVALFSGQLWSYYGTHLSFMPGDTGVMRVNPQTVEITEEITGLTMAVDVAIDEKGNIYIAEMTTRWPTPALPSDFDVFDPESPPDAGRYVRFSGRVTMYPFEGEPVILADNLDQPNNLTYHDGVLYVSTGQGTPGRLIWGLSGLTSIIGEIYRIDVSSN